MATQGSDQRARRGATRVVVVDRFPLNSEALGVVIALQDDLEFVGSATTADQVVDLVTRMSADVAVIDADLPTGAASLGGVEVTKQVKAARPETRVLLMSGEMELDLMTRAASAGACGFLSKASSPEEVCQAIRTAKDGGIFVEQELVAPLLKRVQASASRPIGGGSARVQVTDREQDVLTLLGEGLDVSDIARRLKITVNTCRGHVKSLLSKLGSHSQLEAVVEAVHQGLLPHLGPSDRLEDPAEDT